MKFESNIVSRKHLNLNVSVLDEQVVRATLVDSGSTHGTYHNGVDIRRNGEVILKAGDIIMIADLPYVYLKTILNDVSPVRLFAIPPSMLNRKLGSPAEMMRDLENKITANGTRKKTDFLRQLIADIQQ